METIRDSSARYFPLSQTIGDKYASLFTTSQTIADSLGRYYLLSRTMADKYASFFSMSNRLSDGYPGRGVLHTPLARLSSTPTPFARRLVGRMQYAPTLSEKDEASSGRYFPLYRTMADQYVFHSIMSNRLSDRYPGGAQKNKPPARLSSTPSPFAGRLVGRMQYAPTLPAEKSDLMGWWEGMFGTRGDKSVFHSIMSNRLSDRYPGRAQKHTPLARLSSTHSPLAGRLVGCMQYAPTLSEKDEVSSGRYYLLSRTMADESVFHFSMFNRLSDRYPCRGVLNTPYIDLTSTLSPLAGRLVGRMQYAPTLPEKDEVSLGRYFPSSRTMVDKYVFHFFMSNRLSNRHPGRAQKNTPPARLSSTLSPLTGRLVGRMQYAPTLPAEKSDLKGWWGVTFGTRRDEYVFHFSMSNRLSDRYPCGGVLHTPLARLSSTPSPFAGRLVGRMQYAPTLPAEKSDFKGWWGDMFGKKGDEYVFHSIMSNRLSDVYPGRGAKAYAPCTFIVYHFAPCGAFGGT